MCGFIEVFPNDLLNVPLDYEFDFGIDIVSGTHITISIPPYRVELIELRELKYPLEELLRDFIRIGVFL